jgi:hypothetical protein
MFKPEYLIFASAVSVLNPPHGQCGDRSSPFYDRCAHHLRRAARAQVMRALWVARI